MIKQWYLKWRGSFKFNKRIQRIFTWERRNCVLVGAVNDCSEIFIKVCRGSEFHIKVIKFDSAPVTFQLLEPIMMVIIDFLSKQFSKQPIILNKLDWETVIHNLNDLLIILLQWYKVRPKTLNHKRNYFYSVKLLKSTNNIQFVKLARPETLSSQCFYQFQMCFNLSMFNFLVFP